MSDNKLQDVTLVKPVVNGISGSTRLFEDEVQAHISEENKKAVTLGSKYYIDKAKLKWIQNARVAADRICSEFGLGIGLGNAVPHGDIPELLSRLKVEQDKFYQEKVKFIAAYPGLIASWTDSLPELKKALMAAAPSVTYLEQQIQFNFNVWQINTNGMSALEETVNRNSNDLFPTLISDMASSVSSYIDRAVEKGTPVVTKSVNSLRAAKDKIQRFSFLDNRTGGLEQAYEEVLKYADDILESKGRKDKKSLSGSEKKHFISLLKPFSEESSIHKIISSASVTADVVTPINKTIATKNSENKKPKTAKKVIPKSSPVAEKVPAPSSSVTPDVQRPAPKARVRMAW